MPSNLFSRLLSSNAGSPSIYEALRDRGDSSNTSDIEERAGMAVDEENLADRFHDYELDEALADAVESPAGSKGRFSGANVDERPQRTEASASRPRWLQTSQEDAEAEEHDNEVPQSLLIEDDHNGVPVPLEVERAQGYRSPSPVPALDPTVQGIRARWQSTQQQQQLHQDMELGHSRRIQGHQGARAALLMADPKERALWRWANVENLDIFLKDVYDYFLGNGMWCILLSRVLNLLTITFVVGFSTFLTSCINFKDVPGSKTMSQILVPKCVAKMSGTKHLLIFVFAFLWIAKIFQYILDIRRLRQMHDFYHYLLEIPDTDIQTISWQEVVTRLMSLRDANPATAAVITETHRRFMGSQSKQRMDAHDIANRLMRRDNYLIALFNKDILDLTLPVPFLKNRQLFSKTLEWNLSLCILDFVFNDQGQVRPLFLKDTHRRALSDGLRRRFLFAGVMNVLCAPFIVIYFMMLYFFRYFTEYQKNPSQIGSRQYTPLAEWKFREFNELWHLFQRRVNMSYPFASRYVNQFPKDKTVQVSRFIAFITGALASILALASLIDPESLLAFEITPERTVLFYLGIFGAVWAVARGSVPEETLVFDPEYALNNVTEYTHYLPSQWRGRLHSDEVRKEFTQLYQMKVVVFLEEILSIIYTPFILWFSLPKCSDRLVDFFREFTVHVDGLGYVCSFAVFDFRKEGNNIGHPKSSQGDEAEDLRNEYYSTKDGKMLASYYGFIDNYVTNPKPGAPFIHPSNRRPFHPPPAFPGLTSPTSPEEVRGASNSRYGKRDSRRPTNRVAVPGPSTLSSSARHTPRFAAAGGHSSPVTSVLLDPQHQPSRSSFRRAQRHSSQSRYRASRKALADPIEDDDEVELENESHVGEDATTAQESNLGESWKTTRAGTVEDGDDEGIRNVAGDKDPGVLGLVYQFSKAQTEGRGAGVNI